MEKIFNPLSIAMVGLSSKPTNIPRLSLENMLRWGYRGQIFGVSSRSDDAYVDGIRMFRNIEDLPVVPDLVYSLVPARMVPSMVERCGKMGVQRMAIPSGGFTEFGRSGEDLARRTLENARKYGIRFVGPNGLTVANTKNGLCFPFTPLIKPPKGNISIVSQSGGVGLMILNYFKDENLGMAKFASIGNKLDLDEVDFLEYLGQDPETEIICMYLESISRGRDLARIASEIDKPVVLYKSNTTASGKRAAMSHTAAVSSDDAILDSVCEEAGIIRIAHFHDFLAVSKAFKLPPMRGRSVMVMSPAGGMSVVMADLCEKAGFEFAELGESFYDSLHNFSNAGVIKFSNPLDMGDIYDPQFVAHVICSVMHSEAVDGALYVSFSPQLPSGDSFFKVLFRTDLSKEAWGAILSSGKPLGAALISPGLSQFKQAINVPVFNSAEELVRAMAMQMRYHTREPVETTSGHVVEEEENQAAGIWLEQHTGDLGEASMDLLKLYGIDVPRARTAADLEELESVLDRLDFPLVMKVISPDALHKSDVGGVITDIRDRVQARDAFGAIQKSLKVHKPEARFSGVRVVEMADSGHDLFIGAKQDPVFGPVILFGMGGIYMELFSDFAVHLCPANSERVKSCLKRLKAYSLLSGARGQSTGDVDAFVDLVVRVSRIVAANSQILELDLNPVRVFSKGVLPLDIRIRIKEQT